MCVVVCFKLSPSAAVEPSVAGDKGTDSTLKPFLEQSDILTSVSCNSFNVQNIYETTVKIHMCFSVCAYKCRLWHEGNPYRYLSCFEKRIWATSLALISQQDSIESLWNKSLGFTAVLSVYEKRCLCVCVRENCVATQQGRDLFAPPAEPPYH